MKKIERRVCGCVAADPAVDVLMNDLPVGAGGFINGPDPKILVSRRPYMAMRRGAQNTIFGAPPVCGRRATALRAAGPPYMVRAGDPPSSQHPPRASIRRRRGPQPQMSLRCGRRRPLPSPLLIPTAAVVSSPTPPKMTVDGRRLVNCVGSCGSWGAGAAGVFLV